MDYNCLGRQFEVWCMSPHNDNTNTWLSDLIFGNIILTVFSLDVIRQKKIDKAWKINFSAMCLSYMQD